MMTKIYIASALGFSEIGRDSIVNYLIPRLSRIRGIEFVDPWRGLDELSTDEIREMEETQAVADAIATGDINVHDINSCDAVLAILDGPDVDSGVAAE
ncbi:MAG: nucleoside 2-deoxyribosyltransferase, partial [Thermoplasmata archaeon]